jgi:hypothetical protein
MLCKTGILLSNGEISYKGNISECISRYIADGNSISEFKSPNVNNDMFLKTVALVDKNNKVTTDYAYNSQVRILFEIGVNKFIQNSTLSFTIYDENQSPLFTSHQTLERGCSSIVAELPSEFLLPNTYFLKPILHVPNKMFLDYCNVFLPLNIVDTGSVYTTYVTNKSLGFINVPVNWE